MEEIYLELEAQMLKASDLAAISLKECNERLVAIEGLANVSARQIGVDMQAYTGDAILVRETVLEKLVNAASYLTSYGDNLSLEVIYGYRAPAIQNRLFEEALTRLDDGITSEQERIESAHRQIAYPPVAGHPSGGAVDVQILSAGKAVNFGTPIWDFARTSYTFSPEINGVHLANRKLLRTVMQAAGFAPFDGEWWHFSYGDREWAAYYNQPNAIFGPIDLPDTSR